VNSANSAAYWGNLTSRLVNKVKADLATKIDSIESDPGKRTNMKNTMKDDASPQGMLDALEIMKKFVAIKDDKKANLTIVNELKEFKDNSKQEG
jgi:hypothetical protein